MPVHVELNNLSPRVTQKVADFADLFMGTMAAQIQAQILTGGRVPFYPKNHTSKSGKTQIQRGALRSSIRMVKKGTANYAVTAGTGTVAASYAAAQEAGITRGYVMKKYSTPGTGAHWFQGAIDTVKGRTNEIINTTKDAVGLE